MQSNTSSAFFMPISKTINTMLKGTSAQGRRMKINCRVKKSVPVPSEEWQRTPNAHEPIISQELWDKSADTQTGGGIRPPPYKTTYVLFLRKLKLIPFEDSLSEDQIEIFHQLLDCVSDTAAAEMRAAYKVGFKDGAAMMNEIQD